MTAPTLTPGEKRVLAETDGRTIEEIAAATGMNARLVKYYSDRLRGKFKVKKRRMLIPYAIAMKKKGTL